MGPKGPNGKGPSGPYRAHGRAVGGPAVVYGASQMAFGLVVSRRKDHLSKLDPQYCHLFDTRDKHRIQGKLVADLKRERPL